MQCNGIAFGVQVEIVADMDHGNKKAILLRQLPAQLPNLAGQLTVVHRVCRAVAQQRNHPVANIEANGVDRSDILPAESVGGFEIIFLTAGDQRLLSLCFAPGCLAIDKQQHQQARNDKSDMGHTGHQANDNQYRRRHHQRPGLAHNLLAYLMVHVCGFGNTGHHNGCRRGEQQ